MIAFLILLDIRREIHGYIGYRYLFCEHHRSKLKTYKLIYWCVRDGTWSKECVQHRAVLCILKSCGFFNSLACLVREVCMVCMICIGYKEYNKISEDVSTLKYIMD